MMLQFSRSYAHLRGLQGVMMPTPMLREDEIERKWFVVDADGQVLGRLASRVAAILRGKHKPAFAPHMDVGDHVVVINAEKVHLTGRMLPKNRLGRAMGKKLKVYKGATHPHQAQQPAALPEWLAGQKGGR